MQTLAAVMPLPVIVVQVLVVSLIHFWTNADGKLFIFLGRERTRAKRTNCQAAQLLVHRAARNILNFNFS